jgi:hypothetical protein
MELKYNLNCFIHVVTTNWRQSEHDMEQGKETVLRNATAYGGFCYRVWNFYAIIMMKFWEVISVITPFGFAADGTTTNISEV